MTSTAGIPHTATKILQELNLNPLEEVLSVPKLFGIIIQAKAATDMLPIIQKAANALNIRPRKDLDWNSAK